MGDQGYGDVTGVSEDWAGLAKGEGLKKMNCKKLKLSTCVTVVSEPEWE